MTTNETTSEPNTNWQVFQGNHEPDDSRIGQLPPPPPWRRFRQLLGEDGTLTPEQQAYKAKVGAYWDRLKDKSTEDDKQRDRDRGSSFRIRSDSDHVVQAVNAALALRRPLLITGRPGSGKTSLAYAVAHELQLGPVLKWPITARTTLETGLYRYDAIARLQDAQLRKQILEERNLNPGGETVQLPERTVGDYIQLGPLGTAFMPTPYPRVLLIDEVDKSDINLPNDLLNLLEEGEFEIPELVRLSDAEQGAEPIKVRTADDLKEEIPGGKIRCDAFPLIIMTSNGQRDFPPAFLRRCLRVEMPKPQETDLRNIVEAHLTPEVAAKFNELIKRFDTKTNQQAIQLATDQLLNAVYLCEYGATINLNREDGQEDDLEKLLLAALTSTGGA